MSNEEIVNIAFDFVRFIAIAVLILVTYIFRQEIDELKKELQEHKRMLRYKNVIITIEPIQGEKDPYETGHSVYVKGVDEETKCTNESKCCGRCIKGLDKCIHDDDEDDT